MEENANQDAPLIRTKDSGEKERMTTLVLGGGFGRIVTAHALRNGLAAEHEVTLVDRDSSTGGNVRSVM